MRFSALPAVIAVLLFATIHTIRLNARSQFAEEDKMEETKTGKMEKCLALRDHSKNTEDLHHISFSSATTHIVRLRDNYKALATGISST